MVPKMGGKARMDENGSETDGWLCGRVEMRRATVMSAVQIWVLICGLGC